MAGITLTSKTINSTYDSLLKLTDNDGLTSSFKKITDGLGNDSGISINNAGNVQISGTLNVSGTTTIGSVLRGNATLTIDPAAHGDNTGLVVIAGDLQVDGTTTTINSTTVSIDDKNILLAAEAANKAAANGAGITVETGTNDPVVTDATILYNGTNDTWDFNKVVTASSFTGDLTGDVTGNLTGDTATIGGILLQDSADRSGLLEVNQKGTNSWSGIQINHGSNHWSFMGNANDVGVFDDHNGKWVWLYSTNNELGLYYNGVEQARTQNGYFLATNEFRSAVFRGTNTVYHVTPAGTSNLNALTLGGTLELNQLTNDFTSTTALVNSGSGVVGQRSLGTAAFSDTTKFVKKVFGDNWGNTPEAKYIKLEIPFIGGSGGSKYYNFDVYGYRDYGQLDSQLHYRVYLHARSNGTTTNNFNMDVKGVNVAANEEFGFAYKTVASSPTEVYVIVGEDYSGLQINSIPLDEGNLNTIDGLTITSSTTAPTGHTSIIPDKYLGTTQAVNAQTLDNLDSTQFLRSDANDSTTGSLTVAGDLTVTSGTNGVYVNSATHASLRVDRGSTSYDNNILFYTAGALRWRLWQDGSSDYLHIRDEANSNNLVNFSANKVQVNGDIYGKSVNGAWSNLYRMGGVYFTWDSDSYGTNFNHSITSTYNGSYGDHITLNSYGHVRINIDSNGNGTNTFEIGRHTTGNANTMLTLNESSELTVNGNVRSPIFYDSNNTSYYLNAASTSRINRIDYTELHNTSSNNNGRFLNHSSWGTLHQTDHGYIQIGPANTGYAHIYTDRSNFYFNKMIYINGGTQLNQNDVRSKIFYDIDNTGYYADPASTSNLNNLTVNGTLYAAGSNQLDYNFVRVYENQNYVASSSSTSNRGNFGKGITVYEGYSGGTNRPHTYDATLQVMPTASQGFELSVDWVSQTKTPLKIRSLRDCCNGWSEWRDIMTAEHTSSGNFATTGNMTATNFYMAGIIYHTGDTNTYLQFHNNDQFRVVIAGGEVTEWGNNYMKMRDSDTIRLGEGSDFRMWHDGSNTYFRNYHHASGNMYWQGENTSGSNQALIYMYCNSTRTHVRLYENGSERLRTTSAGVTVYGSLTATSDVIAYSTSDKRLKDNIKPIDNAIDKVQKISGVTFDWNDKQDLYEGHDIGVIAQEVEEVLPEVVSERENGYKAVKYEKIVPLLIEAIKEQQKQIDELKSLINK